MKILNLLPLLPLIQAIPVEPLAAKSFVHDVAITPRLAVYVQTYHDEHNKDTNLSLLPLLGADIQPTHVILAALHIMGTPGEIHLNDDPPDAPMYDELWAQVKALQTAGIKVSCMMGGAAWGTWNYFTGDDSQFHQYYDPLLNNFIKKYNLNGIDIDVEQFVDITVVLRLIKQLYNDMGPGFDITMAPVASALSYGGSLSGFSYSDLDAQARDPNTGAPMISFYNAQFTNGWGYAGNTNDYDSIINAGWDPSRVVMLASAATNDAGGWVPIGSLKNTIRSLRNKYPNFGGVNGWEYFDAGSTDGLVQPYMWMANLRDALNSY
ncbi:3ed4a70a-a38d-4192-a0c1-40c3f952f368 [Sclerotinia trifoliorum]|uniref:chitinase n=1 Tax=Sclerotinia trifoliorum TaxID=28548 RepID=A0A8H2ZN74_9HELO|nr:3ed4a70a-a38d-4192-a0c1-40c3f952f368 [Sclerotinia trifoliorum]